MDDLNADGSGVHIGFACPIAFSGVPGAPILRQELKDFAVFLDEIMRGDFA